MTHDRRVVPFKRWHYDWLAAAGARAEGGLVSVLDDFTLDQLERGLSWTGVVDGAPVICAGMMQQWKGRHTAWAYVARGTLPHMAWITEETRKRIAAVPGRVEFTVRKDFRAGQRWAKALGFEVEAPLLRAFGPQGEDHVGFVRVN